jgi:hypothetical protein
LILTETVQIQLRRGPGHSMLGLMSKLTSRLASPANVAAAAFSVALALLAFSQYRASTAFADGAVEAVGEVVDLRTEKRAILDAQAETFPQVLFIPEGSDLAITSELPTPIGSIGLQEDTAIGANVPILYDPKNPSSVRYGRERGSEGALILLGLAIGALFVPTILRRSSLARMATGGGG